MVQLVGPSTQASIDAKDYQDEVEVSLSCLFPILLFILVIIFIVGQRQPGP
jgi:hypothetical protein